MTPDLFSPASYTFNPYAAPTLLTAITPAFAAEGIIDAMADTLLVLDNEGIVRVANGAACRLFGRAESKLLGSHVREIAATLGLPELALEWRILSGSVRDLESHLPIEPAGITTVNISSFAMRDHEKRPVAFVSPLLSGFKPPRINRSSLLNSASAWGKQGCIGSPKSKKGEIQW
jgi:PAS domain S-box-containing protein